MDVHPSAGKMLTEDLLTPCILIERSRLEANLSRMQALAAKEGVRLRPHIKSHKSIELGKRQLNAGASGITTAKISEAEVFVDAGFEDVLIAYPVVGAANLERVVRLSGQATVSHCVDTVDQASAASAYYAARGRAIDVLVEVDTGYHRCGLEYDSPEALVFASMVDALPGLNLKGILTHAGESYAATAGEDRQKALRRVAEQERDRMVQLATALRRRGLPHEVVSIGSTPTMSQFVNAATSDIKVTEIRPGTYIFNDMQQVTLGAAAIADCALTVLTTVVSKHRDRRGEERVILDAGRKILTSDSGALTTGYGTLLYNPRDMVPQPHALIDRLSEEHGWVRVRGGSTYAVGDRTQLVPNHACVVVNTQDTMYLVDGDTVLNEIRVDARGCVR